MKKIILTFVLTISIFTISFAENNTSSFDNYYKEWKKEHETTIEVPYQNLTDEQKAQTAIETIDKTFKESEIEDLKKTINSNNESITKNSREISKLKKIIIISNSIYVLIVAILIIIILKKNRKVLD